MFKRFLILFLIALVVSFGLAVLVYVLSGHNFTFIGKHLNSEFIHLLFGSFEIIALTIAIYELSGIRSRQQIKKEATDEERKRIFKDKSKSLCSTLKTELIKLQKKVNKDVYSIDVIHGYISVLSNVVNVLNDIDNEQNTLIRQNIINCEICLTLIKELQDDLYKVVQDEQVEKFKRQHFNHRVSDIIKKVSECEIGLNK